MNMKSHKLSYSLINMTTHHLIHVWNISLHIILIKFILIYYMMINKYNMLRLISNFVTWVCWRETGSVNENDGVLYCSLPETPLRVPLPAACCLEFPCVSLCLMRCCPYLPSYLLFFTQLQNVIFTAHTCGA